MSASNLLNNDFVNKLKSKPEEVIFSSDQIQINSFEAFDYYYNSICANLKKENLCAFICNSSLESTLASFFLILDDIKIIFLSIDQTAKEINNVIFENSIKEIIIFDDESTKKLRNDLKDIKFINI